MKYVYSVLITILLSNASFCQIIDQIKDASDNHSSQSSNSDDSYSDDSYSDDSYTNITNDYNTYYYDDYSPIPYASPNQSYWSERKRADSTYKFAALNLLYRQTVNAGQVSMYVPELQVKYGWYYVFVRVNTLIEEGANKEDQFQTVDFQFFGFQTNPKATLVFNAGVGLLTEQYSGKSFFEWNAGFRLQPFERFSLSWEGKLAGDQEVNMLSEGTIQASYAVVKNKDVAIEATAFGTSSTYYEQVRVQGAGFGIGIRF